MKRTKKTDAEILARAGETARAFAELCAALDRRLDHVMDMDDDTPEAERMRLAVRTGLLVENQNAVRDALHCLGLARGYFKDGGTTDSLHAEADMVASYVGTAADRLAVVIGALAVEIGDADAAGVLCRARRAA